jgi:3-hydroxy-3-methylglutaryl CoA synthase
LGNLANFHNSKEFKVITFDKFDQGQGFIIYVTTMEKNPEDQRGILTINQIDYNNRLDSFWQTWSMTMQTRYHKQYEIDISRNENCGNKIKASTHLLVVTCMENGAISIFRRYKGTKLDTKKPLVEIMG